MKKSWNGFVGVSLALVLGSQILPLMAAEEEKGGKEPVGYWRFEGENDVQRKADSSNNSNNINVLDRVEFVPGRSGQALKFTAPDKKERSKSGVVRIDIANKYDFTQGFTFEAWIKPTRAFARDQRYELISNLENDRGKGLALYIGHYHSLFFSSGAGSVNEPLYGASSKPNLKFSPEKWHHVAAVYDAKGGCFIAYMDGVMIAQSEVGLKLTKGLPYFSLGSFAKGHAYGFDGLMDEVKIYDYARTAEEIGKDAAGE